MKKDSQKDCTLLLQQVAKNFREIFGELAPGGRGELVMQKRLRPDPQEQEDPEEDEEAEPANKADAMERYAGVKVKVGKLCLYALHLFNSATDRNNARF